MKIFIIGYLPKVNEDNFITIHHASTVHDRFNWIESHRDKLLSLENVAAKPSDTTWYTHRIFRTFTGNPLAKCIRVHQLTKAAITVRLSNWKILYIAQQYNFHSQQLFSQKFNNQFLRHPLVYRKREN